LPFENATLRSLPEHQQLKVFFTYWTRKEAYIKAVRKRLSIPLDRFDVTLTPGEPLVGLRSDKCFKCGNCGGRGDADLNGAKIIAAIGAVVNQPGDSNSLCCNISTDSSGLLKAHTVAASGQCG